MTNAFNSLLKGVKFQELCVAGGDITQLIPFVCAFYAFESPLFYNHCNHEGDVIVIPSTMGMCQGDPWGGGGGWGALFILTLFRALHFTINHFPSYLFPSIIDDIHIIGPPSIVSTIYEHFKTELHAIGLSIQPKKCIA
jgi:hypothetical protein